MATIQTTGLSPSAIEVLGQLFVNGPTWDGNIISKAARGELVEARLAEHRHGYAYLTGDGVQVATEWDTGFLKATYRRWYEKAKLQK